uniref:Synaptobrevin, longin-like domain protein n=1 Tax=Tanacetum cinerariifolium TaxID=118510 RepID=A0A6L2JKM4_TANCI|nr:hypothetical protein [Tanacetum cinerariifolium]
MNQNFYNSNSFGFDQFQPPQYPVVHQPPQETSMEILQAQENLMEAIQVFLKNLDGDDDDDDYDKESIISTNTDIFETHSSDAITTSPLVLPIEDPEVSLIMGNEKLNTIPEKESNKFIKSSVKDLVPIPCESEDISGSDSECILPSCDDFSPIDIPEEKFVTFSNPLFNSNDDFISSDGESLSDEDVPKDNVKIYSKPLFEFDDEYISSDVNPLFDEVLENIENKDSYDSNLDEPDLLVTPLFDANKDECFDSGGDDDEINVLDCEDSYYDSKGDILYLESFLNDDLVHRDPSIPAMSVASILEGFTNEPPLEENDDFFDLEPKNDDWKKILYDVPILMTEDKVFDLGIHDQIFSPTYVSLPFEDRHYLFFTYVVRILLLYFTYLVVSHFLISSGGEDTIFDLDIFAFHFSHRSGTFICFNVNPNILNESPIEICFSTRFTLNITMIWDEAGIGSLPDAELFENLTLMGYNISPNQKFTFQKGQFSRQWKYLIHTIMQCLSPKSTGFNEFSSNIATALVCLATNRIFNFSKMIFDGMVRNVNNKVSKFLMYLRFLSICLQMGQFGQIPHTHTYVVPFHTRKLFTTLRGNSPSFLGRTVPLFDSMLVPQGEGLGTSTEPLHTPTSEASKSSQHELPSPSLPPSSALLPVADEPASPIGDDSQGEACPTDSGLATDKDRANILKTSTLPSDSTPRVTSFATDEGSMQKKLDELTALCTSLQRQQSEMVFKFKAQELEINSLKARIKLLEDKDGGVAEQSGDDAPIKGRRLDEGEEAAKRVSDDTEEMAAVLTSMDVASILTSGGVQVVPTAAEVATASILSLTLEEKENKRWNMKLLPSICRNQFAVELPIERRIELISDLVKYQDHYAKILKYQTQQRNPLSRKQQKEFYMSVLKSHAGWKARHFKGMILEEIKEKFDPVWKQFQDFILNGSKEEAERFKRKGLRLEQESVKKLKTSEEMKATDEVPEEKVKEMMQLVPVKEIIRLGGSSANYQFFVDMLKHLDREDLNKLWGLVKETLSIRPATSNKEKELWVELKRLFEPSVEDYIWTYTQNLMHAPVEWKLYDTCGVHHVSTKDQDIFMLIEKDYPRRKGLAIVMISYKLQVENYYQMANDLILKIYKIVNCPRQQND